MHLAQAKTTEELLLSGKKHSQLYIVLMVYHGAQGLFLLVTIHRETNGRLLHMAKVHILQLQDLNTKMLHILLMEFRGRDTTMYYRQEILNLLIWYTETIDL